MRTMIGFTALLAGAAHAQVHDADVILFVSEEDVIETGTEEGPGVRVFADALDDGFSPDPGFDSLNGTFDAGEVLGLDILRALHVWDGEDFWEIAEPAMTVSKFGQEMVTPPCDVRVSTGFVFGNANGSGKFHHHVSFFLDPVEPGIYLLALEVWSQDGAPAPSKPVYVVLEEEGHGQDVGAAQQWVADHVFQLDCRVDMSGDGVLNVLDFVALQTAFQGGESRADINGDCVLNVLDFVAFQSAFVEGCE